MSDETQWSQEDSYKLLLPGERNQSLPSDSGRRAWALMSASSAPPAACFSTVADFKILSIAVLSSGGQL